jgi:hypothetical protein
MRTLFVVLASFVLVSAAPAPGDPVHDALEAYAVYQNDVGTLLDANIDSPEEMKGALQRLSRHDPARVSRGWIAYGALTAAQSPAFAAGVESRARGVGRDALLRQLRGDPSYARHAASGSSQAVRFIVNAAGADSTRVARAGAQYETLARTSTAPWITASARRAARVGGGLTSSMRARLRVEALSAQPMRNAEAFGGRGFWDSLAGRDVRAPRGGRGERRGYARVTDHMLTAAALVVLDADNGAQMSAALNEPLTRNCLEMQQLQLRQCASVSHDASEDAYCLARHGLTGPSACFGAVAR